MQQVKDSKLGIFPFRRRPHCRADQNHEMKQDRGFRIPRLRSAENFESSLPSSTGLSPQNNRAKIIAFPEPTQSNSQYQEDLRAMLKTWLQFASLPFTVTRMLVKEEKTPPFEPLQSRKWRDGRFQ